MSIRQVTTATAIAWDSSTITVPAGTVLDVAPGSALESAFGGNLATLSGTALTANVTGSDPAATANS